MRIISSFVREQQRYTKSQLRTKFSFDEIGIENFIKNLKSYGILKAVANSAEQRDTTELLESYIQIIDETAEDDECLYVFTYVGVLTIGNRIIKVYPKYILSDSEPTEHMRLIIKVLEMYSHSDEQIIQMFNGDGDRQSYNFLAVILYLLRDYIDYGLYNNTEDVFETNGEGEINWSRTIDDGFALIEGNRPYYLEPVTRRTVEDEFDFFKRLHECILTDCSKQLSEAGLTELFDLEYVNLSDEALEDFGDREYVLDRIQKELNLQFNTHRQVLLKTIYTYIAQEHRMIDDNNYMCMYGTTAFHAVWEKACSDVFGNKLHVALANLDLNAPLATDYSPNTELIELIEKPKWKGIDTVQEAKETLTPDLITITKIDGEQYFIILDAKYYLLQLENGHKLRGNPGIGDITKQYLYQLAYKEFISDHKIANVRNCFVMPTEKKDMICTGTARLDILSNLGLEDIKIRQMPAEELFVHYVHRKRIDLQRLQLQ